MFIISQLVGRDIVTQSVASHVKCVTALSLLQSQWSYASVLAAWNLRNNQTVYPFSLSYLTNISKQRKNKSTLNYLPMFLTINGLINLQKVDNELRNLVTEDNAVLLLAGLESPWNSALFTESIGTESSSFAVALTNLFIHTPSEAKRHLVAGLPLSARSDIYLNNPINVQLRVCHIAVSLYHNFFKIWCPQQIRSDSSEDVMQLGSRFGIRRQKCRGKISSTWRAVISDLLLAFQSLSYRNLQ